MILDRLEINSNAQWCSKLVIARVALPNAGRRVVNLIGDSRDVATCRSAATGTA